MDAVENRTTNSVVYRKNKVKQRGIAVCAENTAPLREPACHMGSHREYSRILSATNDSMQMQVRILVAIRQSWKTGTPFGAFTHTLGLDGMGW